MTIVPDLATIPAWALPEETVLPVREIQSTIVGSGVWAGTPATIVRLQGCPVGCPWCDQPGTWEEPVLQDIEDQASEEEIEISDQNFASTGWRWISTTRLVALITSNPAQHVVITGGEPALYDLCELTAALQQAGLTVAVETSGTIPLAVAPDTWVTLSPKHNQPGGLRVSDDAYRGASEIIQVITGPDDRRWVDRALKARRSSSIPIYLAPELGHRLADPAAGHHQSLLLLAHHLATEFGCRLALQADHHLAIL
jgi:7-carboxy-7-deazaguanine synthase